MPGGCVVSVRRFGFRHCDVMFICVWAIRTSKTYTIRDKKSYQWSLICYRTDVYLCLGNSNEQNIYDQGQEIISMVVNMLQNWSLRYSSHNSNTKCVQMYRFCVILLCY